LNFIQGGSFGTAGQNRQIGSDVARNPLPVAQQSHAQPKGMAVRDRTLASGHDRAHATLSREVVAVPEGAAK
jgi:hypothetical protein